MVRKKPILKRASRGRNSVKYLIIPIPAIIIVLCVYYLFTGNPESGNRNHKTGTGTGFDISRDSIPKGIFDGKSENGYTGYTETIQEIMERDEYLPKEIKLKIRDLKEEEKGRGDLPQNPKAQYESQYPYPEKGKKQTDKPEPLNPQTIGLKFTAGSISDAGYIPPDAMGAVGPSQYVYIVNGRIRTFSKATGTADGVLNTTTDNFFNSVVTTGWGTSDPRVRYDRISGKWFIVIIDVPNSGLAKNRILLGVSSASVITSSSNFTFYYFQDADNLFVDYPTLGIDNNALYIGGNLFTTGGSFSTTRGYVIRKSSVTGGGPLVFTQFPMLSGSAGLWTPQGVDNYGPSATEGYFIGVDNQYFGSLLLRRVSNPGGTPSVSADIQISTPLTTYFPLNVPHLGNTGGTRAYLDALDDRLFAAHYRIINGTGSIWTSHNIRVNSSGVSGSGGDRDGVRWYEIRGIPTGQTPAVYQSGTIYDNSSSNPVFYFIPSIMVSGQGHAAAGFSSAGNSQYAYGTTAGRLVTDAPGTMQGITNYQTSSTAYNLPGENYSLRGSRRWGDYSYTSLDPDDDMTMWTIQEFCDQTNSWGCSVAELKAPPPPLAGTLTAVPNVIDFGLSSVNVTVTSSSSGFYDPGSGFIKRISAACSNGTAVNSITYNNASSVTLNLNTTNVQTTDADVYVDVTITNPDGQYVTANNLILVQGALPVELTAFTSNVTGRNVHLKWSTSKETNNSGFEIYRTGAGNITVWTKAGFVKGSGSSNVRKDYEFTDRNLNTGKYRYRLKQVDYNGNFEYFALANEVEIESPQKFTLYQNYPNPFNAVTKLGFQIPQKGNVRITVYDITGKEAAVPVNATLEAGYYEYEFSSSNLASGIYFYRIQSGEYTSIRKMTVLK